MSEETNQNETPLEQANEQREEHAKNSPLDQAREVQASQQQALAEKETEAENHRPPPEHNPAGNRKENPQRQLG